MRHMRVFVSMFVCARAPAHVHMCTPHTLIHIHSITHLVTFTFVCVRFKWMTVFIPRPPRFRCAVCTWQSLEQ